MNLDSASSFISALLKKSIIYQIVVGLAITMLGPEFGDNKRILIQREVMIVEYFAFG